MICRNRAQERKKRLTELRQAFRSAGIKLTQQRLVIYDAIDESKEHPDAETVFRRVRRLLPSVSLDTVYRTLWGLRDLGLIATLGAPRDRVRFDGNTRTHHHFVCNACGTVTDFYNEEFDRLKIPGSIQSLGRVEKTFVQVRGCCRRCAQKKETEPEVPVPCAGLPPVDASGMAARHSCTSGDILNKAKKTKLRS